MKFPINDYDADVEDVEDNIKYKYCFRCKNKINKKIIKKYNINKLFESLTIKS